MKRIILPLLLVCGLAACSGDYSFNGSDAEYAPSEHYLVSISQDLLPDYLKALENALNYDAYGYYNMVESSEYITGGASLIIPGNTWTVNAVEAIKGLTITCVSENYWKLFWEGNDYSSLPMGDKECKYTTKCTVFATLLAKTARYHYDWEVSFNCDRIEYLGYTCKIWSAPTMTYTSSSKSYVWDSCDGSAIIEVKKNEETKDYARMDYMGSSHRYFRGLTVSPTN